MATHERSNKTIDDGNSLTKQKPLFCVKFLLHVKNPKKTIHPSIQTIRQHLPTKLKNPSKKMGTNEL